MKTIAVLVVIVIILVVGGIIYMLPRSKPELPADTAKPPVTAGATSRELPKRTPRQASPASQVTVTYSDNSFSPQTVTIPVGTTVNFTTSSATPMWVASDPHPDHTDYPAFDSFAAGQNLPQPGQGFSFKFERVGTWSYHNHNSPADIGIIVVK